MFATQVHRWTYAHLAKPFFFRMDPERVHDGMTFVGRALGSNPVTRGLASACLAYRHPSLTQEVLGIRFPNPVGLAGGFDKDALLTDILPAVGFGFMEIGSVTGEACAGNPGRRLWRLPESRGLVVWYGLKNDGAETISGRLEDKRFDVPLGTNVAKTNNEATVGTEEGIADYVKAFRALADIGDYFTVNVSCPNAFGGEPFGDPARLDALLTALDPIPTEKPVFVKLAVDLEPDDLDRIVEVADRHRVHGFILSNLTKRRDRPEIRQEEIHDITKGGISGKPTEKASNRLIAHLYRTAGDRYVVIGLGGVFSAEDAYRKIRQGATLVQLITGMIFEGPQLIGEINRDLVRLLERDGFSNVSEAVGADHR